jgi:hypothetical protein
MELRAFWKISDGPERIEVIRGKHENSRQCLFDPTMTGLVPPITAPPFLHRLAGLPFP